MANRALIVGGAALLGGGILYWWWRSRQTTLASAAPAPALTAAPGTGLTGISPTSNVTATLPVAPAVIGTSPATLPAPSVAQQVPPAVLQYATTLPPNNQAQFNRMLPSMTSDEIKELNNIVTNNLWGSDSIKAFWNAWRVKYHILDGTYINFADAGQVRDLLNFQLAAA